MAFEPLDLPGIIYSFHFYQAARFTHQGIQRNPAGVAYPGLIGNKYWNPDALEKAMRPAIEFALRYRVHMYVGEFSAIRTAPGDSAAKYLADVISIFEKHGFDWSYHAYREWQGWSLEHEGPLDQPVRARNPTDREKVVTRWYALNDTWDKANANAPTRHSTQYFEMLGNRAIYHDGWVACTTPATLPWDLSTKPPPDVITGYKWELYNVQEDPTQNNDLAAKMPEKLKQLQNLFYLEAAKYGVLPLDNTTLARWNARKPSLTAGRTNFTYSGPLANVPGSTAPHILNKSYTITAERSRSPKAARKA